MPKVKEVLVKGRSILGGEGFEAQYRNVTFKYPRCDRICNNVERGDSYKPSKSEGLASSDSPRKQPTYICETTALSSATQCNFTVRVVELALICLRFLFSLSLSLFQLAAGWFPFVLDLGRHFVERKNIGSLVAIPRSLLNFLVIFKKYVLTSLATGFWCLSNNDSDGIKNVTGKNEFALFHLSSISFHFVHAIICRLLANVPWIGRKELIQVQILVVGAQWVNTLNWVELTFAKTSGTVTRNRVPSNDPRNDCGTHFGSSLFLVSKVVDTTTSFPGFSSTRPTERERRVEETTWERGCRY